MQNLDEKHVSKSNDFNKTNSKSVLTPRIDQLVENVKEKLLCEHLEQTTPQNNNHKPRIPDLNTTDKKKILDLVDILAKINEEKEKYNTLLNASQKEIESYKNKLKEAKQSQEKMFLEMKKQIEDLEEKVLKSNGKKESEFTIIKTQHEIEMKKLAYNHSLQIQQIQSRLKEELQNQRKVYEYEIDKLKKQISQKDIDTKDQKDKLIEREKINNTVVEVLEKEKACLENKLSSSKVKLKAAVYAIRKLKTKLDKKNDVKSSLTQTLLTMSNSENENNEKESKQKQNTTDESMAEDVIISDIFFKKDSLTDILEPVFFANHNQLKKSVDNYWWNKNTFF